MVYEFRGHKGPFMPIGFRMGTLAMEKLGVGNFPNHEMIDAGIMMTPGLVIDGEVKSIGIVPKEPQLLKWLNGE